uniref:putative bifunctional diguanylate cyclase/phosphodiesterase n=2 Tax=Rhizorhapis sp. SPR117 TaxID=2912611 RepID=UPI0030C8A986
MTQGDILDKEREVSHADAQFSVMPHLPLFILSAHDRDVLSNFAMEAGWRPVAARRPAGAEQRFLGSQAQIAVIDARRGIDKAFGSIVALSEAVEALGGALLVLISPAESGRLPEVLAAGATHFLADTMSADTFAVALAFAQRHVERLGGGRAETRNRNAIQRSDALFWRYDVTRAHVTLSPALADYLGEVVSRRLSPVGLLRLLPKGERRSALAIARQVERSGAGAAFAHVMPGDVIPGDPPRRVAHHLYVEAGCLLGEIELLPNGEGRVAEEKDYLTGLSNRRAAQKWIGRMLEEMEGRQAGGPVIILLSIGQFDRMNAAYGQMAGNALLGRVGRRIERLIEEEQGAGVMLARIAGTEFLIGLPHETGADRAAFLAHRLIGAVARPFSAGDHLIRLTARCGIAEAQPDDDAGRLLRRAGAALADAKMSDNQSVRVRIHDDRSRVADDDQLETDLRLALDRGEIEIVFQPQYVMADDRVTGVEALARWNHPKFGALGASALFAAAERSDYLLPLSGHVQKRALEIAAAWPDALSHLRLAINVTAADIAQADFFETFMAQLESSGFPHDRLTVEITESGLIEDLAAASALLTKWRAAGLRVAIDDFGTGYSSLAYLKSLPLDYLKIDSGLAKDITGSERDSIVVRGVIDMAKSLGLKVVAEGVETEQQLALLARKGCDFYQGFLRSGAVGSGTLAGLVG